MSSLVLELQRDAMDDKVPVSALLRKCLVIATKLNLEEFRKWVDAELDGYNGSINFPEYRKIRGELRVHNPYNGLLMPILWRAEEPNWANEGPCAQRVAELEETVRTAVRTEEQLVLTITGPVRTHLMRTVTQGMEPHFFITVHAIHGVLDAVRNMILGWSLKLEKDGILGEKMSFTPEEKKRASAGGNVYNISNSTGVFLGPVKADALQVGDFNSIYADLKRLGIPQKERNDLENIVDELKTADKQPEKKQKLLTAGVNWVVRNADKLGALSETIRKWFEPGP